MSKILEDVDEPSELLMELLTPITYDDEQDYLEYYVLDGYEEIKEGEQSTEYKKVKDGTYRYKYYLNKKGFNIKSETQWIKRNYKGKKVLQLISILKYLNKGYIEDLSDEKVALSININLRTYKEIKSLLIMIGLLKVVRLNASTVLYLLGVHAIEKHDNKFSARENNRITKLTLESLGIEISKKKEKEPIWTTNERMRTIHNKALSLNEQYAMPSTEDISSVIYELGFLKLIS